MWIRSSTVARDNATLTSLLKPRFIIKRSGTITIDTSNTQKRSSGSVGLGDLVSLLAFSVTCFMS